MVLHLLFLNAGMRCYYCCHLILLYPLLENTTAFDTFETHLSAHTISTTVEN